MLLPGYVQTFDMAWGPHLNAAATDSNNWLLYAIINGSSLVIPAWIVQKVVLVGVIFLAGVGAYRLASSAHTPTPAAAPGPIIIFLPYLAGLLYIFNPFFYTRFVAGQWLVLLGYALLPWAVLAIWRFLQKPEWRTAWPVAAWTAAVGLTSIHTIGIVGLVALAMVAMTVITNYRQAASINTGGAKAMAALLPLVKWGSLVVGMWLVANSLWLLPLITGQSQTGQNIIAFGRGDSAAFATEDTVLGSVPLSAALLTGFWADDQNRYQLPSALPVWWLGVGILAVLVIFGLIRSIQRRDQLGIALAVAGLLAWLLSMGNASVLSRSATDLLTQLVPYYSGYREPQKWLMLLALAYAYLAAVGAAAVYEKLLSSRRLAPKENQHQNQYAAWAILSTMFIAPFLYAPNLAFGAGGQLKSAHYPAEWAEAKEYLNTKTDQDSSQATVLVLPWHMYLPISFTGRVVANPARYYFDQRMITSDDAELDGLEPQNRSEVVRYIDEELIPISRNHQNVGRQLRDRQIDYVLLLKEADWQRYGWLEGQADLPIVINNDKLQLYKVRL